MPTSPRRTPKGPAAPAQRRTRSTSAKTTATPRPGTGRGPRRPGQRVTAPRGREVEQQVARRGPHLTTRAGVLVVVAAVLVVSWASSMRAFLQQRSEINQLRASIVSSQRNIASLEREKTRWHDPAYVRDQARARLGWVAPGQTSFQVIGRNGKPLATGNPLPNPNTGAALVPEAWYSKLGSSLSAADHPEKVPVPATRLRTR